MKKKNNVVDTLAIIVAVIFLTMFSWGVTCAIIKLITLCFGWNFSFGVSTGIWLIFVLVNWMRPKTNKE